MATKIRLQRHGKKASAFYHIVIADSRSPRDGKFIEKIGTYNPNTNPATIDLQFERALHWLTTGAEMTNTMRAILSYKGVLYRNHLNKGVTKGALTQEAADKKFEAWVNDKTSKITGKSENLAAAKKSAYEKMIADEQEKNAAKAAKIAAKVVPVTEAPAAEEAPATEAPAAETPAAEENSAEA
ncbi:MAG: 30S ribosomal protein S16 [Crocinitomicaceae bacterium]|nr:30S ribosomal protein S16 [Crocinitomicaceae bacterium]MBK8924877.1 30S ribosomal protein S16 [Crocinitomicaceae bacterium]